MTDGANLLKTTFNDGTWAHYINGPPTIIVINQDRSAGVPEGTLIKLENISREVEYTIAGSPLYSRKFVKVSIIGTKQSTVENIYIDCVAILKASGRGFRTKNETDPMPHLERVLIEFEIDFIDFG